MEYFYNTDTGTLTTEGAGSALILITLVTIGILLKIWGEHLEQKKHQKRHRRMTKQWPNTQPTYNKE